MRLHNFIQCTYTFTTQNAHDYYLSVLLAHQHRLYVLVLSIAGTKHGVHFDVIRLRPLHVIAASRSVPLLLFMSKSEYDVRQLIIMLLFGKQKYSGNLHNRQYLEVKSLVHAHCTRLLCTLGCGASTASIWRCERS